ncbi:MAG: hypothetical protein Q4A17_02575 [Thermoguttaceae bacterium]|nr:hypothetical protein [Thermoguttaceae bacterium]
MKAFIKKFFAQTNFWVTLSAVVMFLFLVSGNLAITSLETPVQAADMADTDEDEDLNLDVLDSEIGESDSKADQNDAPEEETIPEDEPQAETPAEPEAQSILEDTANTDVPEKSVEEVKQKSGKELKKEPVEKNDKKSKIDIPPLETVLPANSAVILRASSVRDFNERLEKLTETNFLMLFKTLGKGSYAKQVAPDNPLGAVLFPAGGTFQWAAFVPMKNYKKFIALLEVNTDAFESDVPEGTVSAVSETLCVAPFHGYALFGPNPAILKSVMAAPKFSGAVSFTPCAIKDPTLSIELTNVLIRFLVQEGRIGMEEFAPVFTPEMLGIQEGSEQMALAKQYFDRINDSISWMDANIQSARIDLSIQDSSTVLSTSFLPKPGTPLAEKILDPYVPLISTRLDNLSFLKVVPTWPSPLFGQVDIPPLTAEKLDAPFNRIRHVEFSLMTPPQNGRLAEGWCFFLEVNDSKAFIKELLVPRAEEVGGQFGANTMSEIGRDLAQQSAERRLNRQLNRQRPPRRYVNPEEAAQRGEMIGGLIGGLIGKAVAKKEAMKVQDYMGYDLYSSDLVQYTQLKKRIKEQNEGTAPPIQLGGGQPGGLVGLLIQQLVTGEANLNLQEQIMGDMKEDPADPPLVATRNLIVTLDPHHLLIVPGNDYVLYDAMRRWRQTQAAYRLPIPEQTPEELAERERMTKYEPSFGNVTPPRSPDKPRAEWSASWETIGAAITDPYQHQVRFASIFVPKEALRTADLASKMYDVEIPERIREGIPADLPPFLMIYTTSKQTGSTFTTIPHEMSKAQFQKLIMALPTLLAK